MALIVLNPAFIDEVWPTVGPMLKRAVDISPHDCTLEQLELLVRQGHTHLLFWEDEGVIKGAATVDFIDYPHQRVAHVGFMGGAGIVKDHVFAQAKEWMRGMGAKTAQCWTRDALVGMYEKMGMEVTHHVMRSAL